MKQYRAGKKEVSGWYKKVEALTERKRANDRLGFVYFC